MDQETKKRIETLEREQKEQQERYNALEKLVREMDQELFILHNKNLDLKSDLI
jgi:wobble nucleotide-excising tRNase